MAIPVAAALALASGLAAAALDEETHEEIVAGKVTAATMMTDLLAASVGPALDFDDTQSLSEETSRLATNGDVVYAAVWKPDVAAPVAEFRPKGEMRPALPKASATEISPDSVLVTKLLTNGKGKSLGAIALRLSLERENRQATAARGKIAGLVGLLTTAIAASMIWVSRRLVIMPLRQLKDAANRLEQGNPEPVRISGNDEIGHLGRAFNAMADAIGDRERRLETVNRRLAQLLDNMRQAILVFGDGGALTPVQSRPTREVFGDQPFDKLRIQDLLFPAADVTADAFDQWVSAAFGVPADVWDDVAPLAPRSVILHGGTDHERVLALDFRPIEENGRIDRIMLLATDETEIVRLERTVKEKEQEHEKQMSALRRLVAGGGQLLVSVLSRARSRLAEAEASLGVWTGALDMDLVESLFQVAHSVKGEARAFDLAALDAAAASLEDLLAILRGRLREGQALALEDTRAELSRRLGATREAVSRAAEMLVLASPIGAAVLDQITVRRSDVDRLLDIAGTRGDEVGSVTRRIASRPLGELVLGVVDAAPRWAAREGKRAAIEVDGRDVLIEPTLARVLPDVLTHLVRNALAHGIEPAAERSSAGKSETGLVRIVGHEGADGLEVAVEDDGRGLDEEAIRRQAEKLGLDAAGDVARLAFADGLSTAPSNGALAGHGVGLAAVQSDLARAGYTASLAALHGGLRVSIRRAPSVRQPMKTAESRVSGQ